MTAHILLVEDNPNDVLLLRHAFSDADLNVGFIVAESALAAFRYIDASPPYVNAPRPPDLILLDLNLPAMKGTVVLPELKRPRYLRDVPTVVLTSSHNAQELR